MTAWRALFVVVALGGCELLVHDPEASNTGPIYLSDGGEVLVPAGPFEMGCKPNDQLCSPEELPEHEVVISSFAIDVHETTRAEYTECVDDGACDPPGGGWNSDDDPRLPITNLDWFQADAYCAFRGKRLPTEAEWEKAAQSADGGIYPWGDERPNCSLAQLNICTLTLKPVGSFPKGASRYGALDMAGNAQEWVADWFDEDYYAQSPREDPMGPGDGEQTSNEKAVRGGSYFYPHVGDNGTFPGGRNSYRDRNPPEDTFEDVGVRCARSIASPP